MRVPLIVKYATSLPKDIFSKEIRTARAGYRRIARVARKDSTDTPAIRAAIIARESFQRRLEAFLTDKHTEL